MKRQEMCIRDSLRGDDHGLAGADTGEEAAHGLGLDLVQLQAVHHLDVAGGGLGGQGGLQSQALHLLVQRIAVRAGLGGCLLYTSSVYYTPVFPGWQGLLITHS